MREKGFDQLPVLATKTRKLIGLVTLGNLLSWISQGRASPQSPVSDVMFSFSKITEVVTDPRDVGHVAPPRNSNIAVTNGEADSQGIPQKRRFVEINMDTPLSALGRFFEWNSAAVVTEMDHNNDMKPLAVVTKVDLLTWHMHKHKANGVA